MAYEVIAFECTFSVERAKSDREEFQVVKKGRKYHGCGKEKTYKKEKGGAISSSL